MNNVRCGEALSSYTEILSLSVEEKIVLLKRLGVKSLSASVEDKIAFACAAIACGAFSLAGEVLSGVKSVPIRIKSALDSGDTFFENEPSSILIPYVTFKNGKLDHPTLESLVVCHNCLGKVKISVLNPRLGKDRYLCPHCLAVFGLDKQSLKPHLEELFIDHIQYLEKKLRKKEFSYKDCEQVVMLADSVSPWLKVRFGLMRSERIGHFALNTEQYITERDADILDSDTLDFLGHNDPVSNNFLKLMWNRILNYSPVASVVAPMLAHESPYSTHKDLFGKNGRDDHLLWHKTKPSLSFTDKEKEMGCEELRRMGIGPNDKYVCLNVRDGAYLNAHLKDKDWSYHDFRDADIDNYKSAALELAERGLFVLRMGAVVEKKFDIYHPRIIDYSCKYRSEFMDVFLCATCKFMISCGTGLDGISMIFRRPVLFVNYSQLHGACEWHTNLITLYKHFFSVSNDKEMSFKEIIEAGAVGLSRSEDLVEKGVYLKENTPEEIRKACIEMNARIDGEWEDTPEMNERQELAKQIVYPHKLFLGRFGDSYLRENPILLR